jgi:hypothetical protein
MRKLIAIATCALAAAALPTLAAAGAVHFSETFVDEPTNWFMGGGFPCDGGPAGGAAGTGIESGTVQITETPNGGGHIRVDIQGSVDLYELLGGGPENPQLGDYVATWTYSAHLEGQFHANETEVQGGVTKGPIVFADGRQAMLKIGFHILIGADGPKLFFAHAACGGE